MVRGSQHSFRVQVPTRKIIEREDGTHFIAYDEPCRMATITVTIDWPRVLRLAAEAAADRSPVMNTDLCMSFQVEFDKT